MKNQYLTILLTFFVFSLSAKVIDLEIEDRTTVLDGKEFGEVGAYELIRGYVTFGFDPQNPNNQQITDIELAPTNENGLVVAKSRFAVLQPVDLSKSSGVALVEVSNRGGKFSMRYFNRAINRTLTSERPEDYGDELLMKQGLTVIWVGWQFDAHIDLLKIDVPNALNKDGSEISGMVRSDWTLDLPITNLGLGHRMQTAYPAANFNSEKDILTVRDGRDAPRTVVPRHVWRFAKNMGNNNIFPSNKYITGGFQGGKIYELVYETKGAPVIGLGLAAVRDMISYAKYDGTCPFPVKKGIAAGVSQTGRFLRMFLYQGFNVDENNQTAYDGMMIITAGAGRGSFNHRFGQPSRDAHRYSAFFYPTDLFPFTSKATKDELTGKTDGLLKNMMENQYNHLPKIFYINTGYEYWGRAASLIHTTPDSESDVVFFPFERIYHLASGQHFVEQFPPKKDNTFLDGRMYRGNHLDFSVNYRALLIRLVEWVEGEKTPPSSQYPSHASKTLVNIRDLNYPYIPYLELPSVIHTAYRADYGDNWENGLIDFQPPKLGAPFIPKVSQVDEYGNELSGIRNVEITVPLATYLPWNLRTGKKGDTHELTDFRGTFIPFPLNDDEKGATRDSRPTVESLYSTKEIYIQKVKKEAKKLVDDGFLLAEDVEYVVLRASDYWDWLWHTKKSNK